MSLVADYGASSSSESDSDSDSSEKSGEILQSSEKASVDKLPKPDFQTTTSVFSNPFIEAENAKQAILEKHVKMVPTKKDTVVINGKKICWNYRKGRCRFGHKCQYAHDSDLQRSNDLDDEEKDPEENVSERKIGKKKSKRPGLTQGLIPGKKVMKMFHQQQNQPLC